MYANLTECLLDYLYYNKCLKPIILFLQRLTNETIVYFVTKCTKPSIQELNDFQFKSCTTNKNIPFSL